MQRWGRDAQSALALQADIRGTPRCNFVPEEEVALSVEDAARSRRELLGFGEEAFVRQAFRTECSAFVG